MKKQEILKQLENIEVIYKPTVSREIMTNDYIKQLKAHNSKTEEKLSYKVENNCFKISNGNFVMLPIEPIIGKLQVRSKDIVILNKKDTNRNMYIDIKNITIDNLKLNCLNGIIKKVDNSAIIKITDNNNVLLNSHA